VIVADTSVWIDHFNSPDSRLIEFVSINELLMHPFVAGEILLGNVKDRRRTSHLLSKLPQLLPVRHADVLAMIENSELFGCGIGYVDAHLVAAVRLREVGHLWTRDKRLHAVAEKLGVAATIA
jgi:predicted nucleic acid-binding protein